MATNLPTDVDATYPDRDPGDALHQQHHDAIHAYTNTHDTAPDPHGDRAYADATFVSAGQAQVAFVAAFETTTASTAGDLATVGPTVTIDVPASGQVMVVIQSWARNSVAGKQSYMGFATSGSNTLAADLDSAVVWDQDTADYSTISGVFILTGLTAGSATFTAKFWSEATGTATFGRRRLSAVPI